MIYYTCFCSIIYNCFGLHVYGLFGGIFFFFFFFLTQRVQRNAKKRERFVGLCADPLHYTLVVRATSCQDYRRMGCGGYTSTLLEHHDIIVHFLVQSRASMRTITLDCVSVKRILNVGKKKG